ncbi:MAG: hypothetical protein HY774_19540 [Acidobacteria bacterium]|nr:hypothetical protein [Acidobacteriota bacterium]
MSYPSSTPSLVRSYIAIALVSCAVLLFEIAITRILSVVSWYHFAFLAVSLAMLGLGVPGVWFSLKKPGESWLERLLLVSGVVVPLSIIVLLKGKMITPRTNLLPDQQIFLDYETYLMVACVFLPLLFLGGAVCLLLMQARGADIGRMYAADLLGATCGALALVPLMNTIPTPVICAGAGFLPLIAACVLKKKISMGPGLMMVFLIGIFFWGEPVQLRYSKFNVEGTATLYEKWTPTARITIFPNTFFGNQLTNSFLWGAGRKYVPEPIDQLWLQQDGSAGTPITQLKGTPQDLKFLDFDVTTVGYQLRPINRACVIGGGGGRDILTAVKARVKQVDAVELNAHIVAALSGPFREYSGDVYHLPGVTPYVSEGRSFLTHSAGNYGMIQISLIDSWAATAAGAFTLSENYLYTVEAFRLYWQRTSPTGMISISRWFGGPNRLETLRLMVLANQALKLEGIADPRQHLCALQAGALCTLILSRTPFDPAQIAKIDQICTERGFVRHWPVSSETPADSPIAEVFQQGTEKYTSAGLNLAPPTDDQPFFFQTISLWKSIDKQILSSLSKNEHSVALLRTLLGLISGLTIGLFLIPFLFRQNWERSSDFWRGSSYFWCIGLAFMLVEVPWMQRFVLYLGHPSYATTVVLATLLLSAGLGSLTASRLSVLKIQNWGMLLPLLVLGVNLLLTPVFEATLGWTFFLRLLVSVVLLFPAGLVMGFAFPTGMGLFSNQNMPWFWAMNGIASVLASVFSLAIAMTIGFFYTALFGVVAYVLAYLVLSSQRPISASTQSLESTVVSGG